METATFTEENADYFPGHTFRHFRRQGKLLDLRITTKDGKCVEAHRLIMAARFPLIRKAMTSGEGKMAIQWRRFAEHIVEAAVNYAYTGNLTISTTNVTQLYLLAHNLGSGRIVSWCVEFLRSRITLENVGEIWSIANITLNGGLIELCIPLMAKHFDKLCFRRDLLLQTTSEYLAILLENNQQEGVSEEVKFRAISKWLEAGFEMRDLEKRAKEFIKMMSKLDLTGLSPQFLTEFWKLGEGICRIGLCRTYFTKSWNEANQDRDQAGVSAFLQLSATRDVLLAYGWNRTSRLWTVTSIPQLQPEESINIPISFNGEVAVSNGRLHGEFNIFFSFPGRFYVLGVNGAQICLMIVNFRDGFSNTSPVPLDPRSDYSITMRNNKIFIFGGQHHGRCLPTCENLDTTSYEVTKLPDMPTARHGVSVLSVPNLGIVVVGGSEQADWNSPTSQNADMVVEDPTKESGWQWMKLSPMLKKRYRPGIAFFNEYVIVAGGESECTVESLSLTSKAQWTLINGIDKYGIKTTSLAPFYKRLILLLSDEHGGEAYEFQHTGEDQSLENFVWVPLFWMGSLMNPRLLVTNEREEGC